MKSVLQERFRLFGLELHETKTRIVYCKDADRVEEHADISFDFLGYTFRPRLAKNKYGKIFLNYLPAMSDKAIKALKEEVRSWKVSKSLTDFCKINSHIILQLLDLVVGLFVIMAGPDSYFRSDSVVTVLQKYLF